MLIGSADAPQRPLWHMGWDGEREREQQVTTQLASQGQLVRRTAAARASQELVFCTKAIGRKLAIQGNLRVSQ